MSVDEEGWMAEDRVLRRRDSVMMDCHHVNRP